MCTITVYTNCTNPIHLCYRCLKPSVPKFQAYLPFITSTLDSVNFPVLYFAHLNLLIKAILISISLPCYTSALFLLIMCLLVLYSEWDNTIIIIFSCFFSWYWGCSVIAPCRWHATIWHHWYLSLYSTRAGSGHSLSSHHKIDKAYLYKWSWTSQYILISFTTRYYELHSTPWLPSQHIMNFITHSDNLSQHVIMNFTLHSKKKTHTHY